MPVTGGVSNQTALVVLATLAAIAAMAIASEVFAPVAFALFIIALVWPLQKSLQTALPKLLALAITILVVIAVFVGFGLLIGWAFGRVGRAIVSDAVRLQILYDQAIGWLDGHGIAVAGLWGEKFNVGLLLRTAQTISGRLNTTMSFWLVVFVYVLLGLLEVDDFGRKLAALRNKALGEVILRGSIASAAKIRRYMLVRTQMSIVTGVLVWAFARLVDLQLAEEWGFIAFSLNYIPFLGPLIATLFPTLFAMAQFESWQSVILVFAALNIIQFVVGSYVEPRVSGTALAISPVVVLFAVFFWSYLWGIFGAFIGVPIAIAFLSYCAEHPSTRWLADLFGSPDNAPPSSLPVAN